MCVQPRVLMVAEVPRPTTRVSFNFIFISLTTFTCRYRNFTLNCKKYNIYNINHNYNSNQINEVPN